MTETFEQMALRKWQEACKSLSVGAPVAIKYAAAIRDELAKGAEPVVINEPNYHYEAMGCGIEDLGITDRYEAMRYGWDRAVERMFEQIPDEPLYTFPPSAAARIAELEEQLAEKGADIERLYRAIDDNWVSQKQIVVSQLRVKQLQEATECLLHLCEIIGAPEGAVLDKARYALATPTDTTALQSLVAKAGEVMRERAIAEMADIAPWEHRVDKISAIPAITLDDLKGGAA